MNPQYFYVYKKGISKILWNKKYYFAHGDEIQLGDYQYKIYKKVINSTPLAHLANSIIPYSVLDLIGTKASQLSRMNHRAKSYDFSVLRESYRQGAMHLAKKIKPSFIICGHSHIQDDFSFSLNSKSSQECRYLNNGYAPETKTFLFIDEHQVQFIRL